MSSERHERARRDAGDDDPFAPDEIVTCEQAGRHCPCFYYEAATGGRAMGARCCDCGEPNPRYGARQWTEPSHADD